MKKWILVLNLFFCAVIVGYFIYVRSFIDDLRTDSTELGSRIDRLIEHYKDTAIFVDRSSAGQEIITKDSLVLFEVRQHQQWNYFHQSQNYLRTVQDSLEIRSEIATRLTTVISSLGVAATLLNLMGLFILTKFEKKK